MTRGQEGRHDRILGGPIKSPQGFQKNWQTFSIGAEKEFGFFYVEVGVKFALLKFQIQGWENWPKLTSVPRREADPAKCCSSSQESPGRSTWSSRGPSPGQVQPQESTPPPGMDYQLPASEPKCFQRPVVQSLTFKVPSSSSGYPGSISSLCLGTSSRNPESFSLLCYQARNAREGTA